MTEPDLTYRKGIRDRFRDFVAKNRKDNLGHHSSWHERLQNIYVSHHRLQQPDSGKSRIWRNQAGEK